MMNADIRLQVSFKNHRKRKRLMLKLGSDGVLALLDLWLGVAVNRPCGNLVGWDSLDIALEANYGGDPEKFVEVLCETGFLDKTENGYALHDWQDHNPYAAGSEERSNISRFNKLKSHYPDLHENLYDEGYRSITAKEYQAVVKQYLSSAQAVLKNGSSDSNGASSPIPSPIPTPIPTPEPKPTFDEFYEHYPKKKNRAAAERSWARLKPSYELLEKMLVVLESQKESKDWKKDNGQFIPYPATWLNGRRWEDDVVSAYGIDEEYDPYLARIQ